MADITTAVLIILTKDDKILFLKRAHGFGANTYSLPGGSVERHETLTQACIRETYEEVGIELDEKDLSFINLSHIKQTRADGSLEYLLVTFSAHVWKGEPFNKEPEKHSAIAWLDSTQITEPLYPFARELLQAYRDKKIYTEFGWD